MSGRCESVRLYLAFTYVYVEWAGAWELEDVEVIVARDEREAMAYAEPSSGDRKVVLDEYPLPDSGEPGLLWPEREWVYWRGRWMTEKEYEKVRVEEAENPLWGR